MRLITIFIYFILAIAIFSSFGITIPYCIESMQNVKHSFASLNQNIVTYFIAILASASIDYILKLLDKEVWYRKTAILVVVLCNVLIVGMTFFILYQNTIGIVSTISGWAIFGVILSYIMWWIANYGNTSFNLNAPLGGSADKPLRNG